MAEKKTGAGRTPRDPHNDPGKGKKGEEDSRASRKDPPGGAGKATNKGLK